MRAIQSLLLTLLLALGALRADAAGTAMLLEIDGPIGPAVADFVCRGIEEAPGEGHELIVLQMNTPGGLDSAMRDIIKAILTSPLAVVSYVAPSGSRAASAGTYILYASHVAAMAPGTNLGAATPVQVGGLPTPGGDTRPDSLAASGGAMERKAVNDATAYLRGLAQLRERNVEWAERAVREAASLSAEEALEQGVIDLLAVDHADLLRQCEGRSIMVLDRREILAGAGLELKTREPDWRSKLLSVITDPTVAYLLMLLGFYGLLFEFAHPGHLAPGVIGAICLLLALYAFQVLPINYAGVGLILLGIAFMVSEAFAPSFGALGLGGIAAFIIGSVILFDTDLPGFYLFWPVVGLAALLSAGFLIVVVGMAVKARRRPVVSGREEMMGAVGEALEDFQDRGRVYVHSELWNAVSDGPVTRGQRLRVTGIDGLLLSVTPETDKPE